MDGHERDGVVRDPKWYIGELLGYLPRMDQYGGENMDVVTSRTATDLPGLILVVHDEVGLHQSDGENWSYQQVRNWTLRALRATSTKAAIIFTIPFLPYHFRRVGARA